MAEWQVLGWDAPDGDWRDVEDGDPAPDDDDLRNAGQIVIGYTDDDDVIHYYTLWSEVGWEPDELEAEVDDLGEFYGIAA